MATIHYRYAPAVQEPQLIAAFRDTRTARTAYSELQSLPVQADLIVTPTDDSATAGLHEEQRSNRTITGAIIGAVWGMLMAAMFINFLTVNPGIITIGGMIFFGAVGGMALGGFIGGVGNDEREAPPRPAPGATDARAFVTVHADAAEDVEAANGVLRRRHAVDIYRI
jgi:hypothetical protein